MPDYHIAQVNIGRIKAALDHPVMEGFVSRLDEINALADNSPGFVWRLQNEAGNNTYLRPYDDDRILFNFSIWETLDSLHTYVYKTAHAELLRDRRKWYEQFQGAYMALWWVPRNYIPGVDEAKRRLAHLEEHGPSQFAFTFKKTFRPDPDYLENFDWSMFKPCRASA